MDLQGLKSHCYWEHNPNVNELPSIEMESVNNRWINSLWLKINCWHIKKWNLQKQTVEMRSNWRTLAVKEKYFQQLIIYYIFSTFQRYWTVDPWGKNKKIKQTLDNSPQMSVNPQWNSGEMMGKYVLPQNRQLSDWSRMEKGYVMWHADQRVYGLNLFIAIWKNKLWT